MSTSPSDFDTQIIDGFRANGGPVGGMLEGNQPLLLEVVPVMILTPRETG